MYTNTTNRVLIRNIFAVGICHSIFVLTQHLSCHFKFKFASRDAYLNSNMWKTHYTFRDTFDTSAQERICLAHLLSI